MLMNEHKTIRCGFRKTHYSVYLAIFSASPMNKGLRSVHSLKPRHEKIESGTNKMRSDVSWISGRSREFKGQLTADSMHVVQHWNTPNLLAHFLSDRWQMLDERKDDRQGRS